MQHALSLQRAACLKPSHWFGKVGGSRQKRSVQRARCRQQGRRNSSLLPQSQTGTIRALLGKLGVAAAGISSGAEVQQCQCCLPQASQGGRWRLMDNLEGEDECRGSGNADKHAWSWLLVDEGDPARRRRGALQGAVRPGSAFPSPVGIRKLPHQLPRACQELLCQETSALQFVKIGLLVSN